MKEAYPLNWPIGHPRTKHQKRSRFDSKFTSSRDNLVLEIKRIGGKNPIISSNVPLKNDGLPYAKFKKPDDCGVAVYFELDSEPIALACDKWDSVEDNMQAIRKTIEALRGLDRWGVSDMLKRVFTGFKALPEHSSTPESNWWDVLEIDHNSTVDQIRSAYRSKAKEFHPDAQGTNDSFVNLCKAFESAMEARK